MTLSDKQIIFDDKQIKSLDELKLGAIYNCINAQYGKWRTFKFLSKDAKDGWIKVFDIRSKCEEEISLADNGLVPYKPENKWTAQNYLIVAEDIEKEYLEAMEGEPDYTICDTLEQLTKAETIIKYAKRMQKVISNIENGDFNLEELNPEYLRGSMATKKECDEGIDNIYFSLDSDYRNHVKGHYKQFLLDSLCLKNKIEARLKEE
jgi:exonuclease VII small subunit